MKGRLTKPMQRTKELTGIWRAAIAAVDPSAAVQKALQLRNGRLIAAERQDDLAAFQRVLVIGAGKATAAMAEAVEILLGGRISDGLIIVKHGHAGKLGRIEQVEAGHPIPDTAGVEGTARILELAERADERTLVLCLLSCGGSSLLVAPADGIRLEDKQNATNLLLRAGASIDELNAVRKHLSAVKGGLLARKIAPAPLITLILSDVLGDRLDVIASGPTVPDPSTFRQAWEVIGKYGLADAVPVAVRNRLMRGISGFVPETPKEGEACFGKARAIIVGGLSQAMEAAREEAGRQGFLPEIVTTELRGDVREAAKFLAQAARKSREALKPGERRCLLSGGETTVRVAGSGKGGRNQELALAFAAEIAGVPGIALLSSGTDGTDGPTDAAGAFVDGETIRQGREHGLDADAFLADNDSYRYLQRLDAASGGQAHFKPGPTGTNVMDLQIIIIEK